MTMALRDALERQGVHTSLLLIPDEWSPSLLEAVQQEDPDCTWSINRFVDASFWYYPAGIPHVDLSVDACTYCHPYALKSPHLVQLFVDQASCDFFSAYTGKRAIWFPHAISQSTIDHVRASPSIPLELRPLDTVLLGSYIDHRNVRRVWESSFPVSDVEAFVSIAERTVDDPSYFLFAEALSYFERSPTVQQVIEQNHLSPFSLANTIELFARGLDRERLLHALKGRSLSIFTSPDNAAHWSKEEEAQGCLMRPQVPFDEVIDVCRQSRVVINSVPTICKGYHERLFLALAAGAVTIVGRGKLPPSFFRYGRLVEYDQASLETLQDRIVKAERSTVDQEEVLSWLECEHTWDVRLKNALPHIDEEVTAVRQRWNNDPFSRLAGLALE
jgi:hypothetical protein